MSIQWVCSLCFKPKGFTAGSIIGPYCQCPPLPMVTTSSTSDAPRGNVHTPQTKAAVTDEQLRDWIDTLSYRGGVEQVIEEMTAALQEGE